MSAYPTPEQRAHPNFCKVYARRTPMIPFHNGMWTYRSGPYADESYVIHRRPCLGCGAVAPDPVSRVAR